MIKKIKRQYQVVVKLILALILGMSPVIVGAAWATVASKTDTVPVPQQIVDQLQSKMINFIKRDAHSRNFMLHDINIKLISQKMQNDNTAEAVFYVTELTTINYKKPEDVPVLRGILDFKNQNLNKLSSSDMRIVNKEINKWEQDLNRYITTPLPGNAYMKIVGQINKGTIDPTTVKFYLQGLNSNQYVPYSLNDTPSSSYVQQKAFTDIKTKVSQNTVTNDPMFASESTNSLYDRNQASDYANYYTSNATTYCQTGSSVFQDKSKYNTYYEDFTCDDCANYASQALSSGGIPQDETWWGGTYSESSVWTHTDQLFNYMLNMAYIAGTSKQYCLEGYPFRIPSQNHSMIMVYNDGTNQRFSAHTSDRCYYWWNDNFGAAEFYEVIY